MERPIASLRRSCTCASDRARAGTCKTHWRNDCFRNGDTLVPVTPKEPAAVPNIINRVVAALERWLTQGPHASHQSRDKSSAARSLDYDAYIRANVHDAKLSDRNP